MDTPYNVLQRLVNCHYLYCAFSNINYLTAHWRVEKENFTQQWVLVVLYSRTDNKALWTWNWTPVEVWSGHLVCFYPLPNNTFTNLVKQGEMLTVVAWQGEIRAWFVQHESERAICFIFVRGSENPNNLEEEKTRDKRVKERSGKEY